MTSLIGDATDLCEQLAQASLFLVEHPLALQSFAVLDDLAQAFGEMGEIEPPWAAMAIKCGERARAILDAILPAELRLDFQSEQPQALILPWVILNNRPALRLITREIDARLRLHHSDQTIDALMTWMLRLNPNDNHNNRYWLTTRLLEKSQAAKALAICERYPDSIGPMKANYLLALFSLNRRDEAQIIWQDDGRDLTEIRKALLAERYARPRELDSGFVTVGGRGEAWDYRDAMRDCWRDAGAIEWLVALPQPQPQPQAQPQGTQPHYQFSRTDDPVKLAERVSDARREYDEIGGDPIYMHGVITGVAISPARVGSSTWVSLIFRPPTGAAPAVGSIEQANRLLAGGRPRCR